MSFHGQREEPSELWSMEWQSQTRLCPTEWLTREIKSTYHNIIHLNSMVCGVLTFVNSCNTHITKLTFNFNFYFGPYRTTCGILVPLTGIEPFYPWQWESRVLASGPPEFPFCKAFIASLVWTIETPVEADYQGLPNPCFRGHSSSL